MKLPKNMIPSIEYFKQVGFIFEETNMNDDFYEAKLPENWKTKTTSYDNVWSELIDEHDRKRGIIQNCYLTGKPYAIMKLYPRYRKESNFYKNNSIYEVKLIDHDGSTIYKVRSERADEAVNNIKSVQQIYDDAFRLDAFMEEYIAEYIPDISNPNAYWGTKENLNLDSKAKVRGLARRAL